MSVALAYPNRSPPQFVAANVFSLPVFTQDFCAKFIQELGHFERTNFPKGHPNTMNKGGVRSKRVWYRKNDLLDLDSKDHLCLIERVVLFSEVTYMLELSSSQR